MDDQPYARQGLASSQLESSLKELAALTLGEVVGVAVPGRGGVLWHGREVRLIGPVTEEFRRAIEVLLEDTRLESGPQVRDALLSMGGARLVVQRLIERP
jgi:hypothetical protein